MHAGSCKPSGEIKEHPVLAINPPGAGAAKPSRGGRRNCPFADIGAALSSCQGQEHVTAPASPRTLPDAFSTAPLPGTKKGRRWEDHAIQMLVPRL